MREEPTRALGKDQIEVLLKQGQDFVSVGDFPSARILFKRIAEAGDARGAFALAATYDPVALAKIGAAGAKPDEAKAREWYQKAKALDGEKTGLQLNALTIKLP
jgi:TPR repeat protein